MKHSSMYVICAMSSIFNGFLSNILTEFSNTSKAAKPLMGNPTENIFQ